MEKIQPQVLCTLKFIKMRSYFFIFTLFVFSSCKITSWRDDIRYKESFKYLANDFREQDLYLVDTLVFIPDDHLLDKMLIGQQDIEKASKIIDSFALVNEKRNFSNEYHYFKMGKSNKNAPYNVYFSKPIDDYLLLTVLSNQGNYKNSYRRLTYFNRASIYKITFKNGRIIKVEKDIIEYN